MPESAINNSFSLPLSVKMVMIDLDGTLIHTAPDLAASANRMLEDLDMPTHPQDQVERWIGNGVARLVKRALTGQMQAEPEAALFDQAYTKFLEHYARSVSALSRPYPGVVEGLNALKEAGFELACITNKAESFTLPLLKDLQLHDYFGLILSGDSLPKKKPDPLPLLHACEYFQITPDHGVLVGDSANDTQAAQAAGMPAVCVSYGYSQGVDVRGLGAQAVIDSLEELPQYIQRYSTQA